MEALENLGLFATGTAAAGLIARYGIQRFSAVVEDGIERSAEAAEQGIDRSAAVVEDGIEQFFETKLARHRAELDAQRVASSRLQEDRASVVLELYQRFVRFERDLRALETGTPGDPSSEALLQQATESGNDFGTYYAEHKIYFPSGTCEILDSVQAAMTDVLDGFRDGGPHSNRLEQQAGVRSAFGDYRGVADEIPERRAELESHFRALLGADIDEDNFDDN